MTALGGSDHARAAVAHYDERAASYDDSALHRGLTDEVARFVDLDGVRSVLDVATGTGLVADALSPHGFRLVRDTTWEHADDRLLICELVRP